MAGTAGIETLFAQAQKLAREGRDEEAKQALVEVLKLDPTHFGALTDLGGLALATGYRSAAKTAYRQAVGCHPDNPFGFVNLANLLLEDGEVQDARELYEKALAIDPSLAFAHQGLATALEQQGDHDGAARNRAQGYAGHSIVERPFRGTGRAPRVLLTVSARGGNVPTNVTLDDRLFAVTAVYADYFDGPLPEHDVAFNAIGDADLCADPLEKAGSILSASTKRIINPPARIRGTGRSDNAVRLAGLADVVVPRIARIARSDLTAQRLHEFGFGFPLLLRSPGYHTGQNFVRVEEEAMLAASLSTLPGDELLAIAFIDVRGQDGMARKYRAMFIDGAIYPLHLALSHDWKVHYFSSAMAENDAYRCEERSFLRDMAGAIGARAMNGLAQVQARLGLDYGGADFTVGRDGRLILFEANATMAIVPPPPDPVWDYRREPIARAIQAVRDMINTRAAATPG